MVMKKAKKIVEKFEEFERLNDHSVISKIMRIPRLPVDKRNQSLIFLKRTAVDNVFPPEYFGYVYTPLLKIVNQMGFIVKNKRFLSEDVTYKMFPETQKILPRCYSILMVFESDSKNLVARHVLQGYYKFGGEARDEDSHIDTHSLLIKSDLEQTERVISTEKSNGKAAVITMFVFQKELYVFGGSKSQHYIGRMDKGILSFKHLNKDFFAWQILDSFFKAWNNLKKESQHECAVRLVGSGDENDDGYSMCGEYEDGKHMIPLDTKDPRIVMFGLVKNLGSISKSDYLCLDVVDALQFFKQIGFDYTHFDIYEISEFEKIKGTLREKKNKEGYVLHYQKKNPEGKYFTLGVEKLKTWYYIIIRAVREFVMNSNKNFQNDDWRAVLRNKLLKKNREYMKMPQKDLLEWIRFSTKFIEWMTKEKYDKNSIGFGTKNTGMGNLWQKFVESDPEISNELKNLKYLPSDSIESTQMEKPTHRGVLVIVQGIPGLGKSFMAAPLISALSSRGLRAVSLEQDPFYEKYGQKRSGEFCLKKCLEHINSGEYDAILLMRNNSEFQQYRQYANLAQNNDWAVHVIAPRESENDFRVLAVCLASVYHRNKDAKNPHPTFKKLSMEKCFAITFAFFALLRKARKRGVINDVGFVNWLVPQTEGWPSLDKRAEKCLQNIFDKVKKAKNPFKFNEKGLNAEEIADEIGIKEKNYNSWRVKKENLAEKMAESLCRGILGKIANKSKDKIENKESEVKTKKMIPHRSMIYIYSTVDGEAFEAMLNFINRLDGVDTTGLDIKIPNPHVTFIFRDHDHVKGRKIWERALQMMEEKEKLKVVVNGIAHSPRKLICFTCRLFSGKTGENLDSLVFSGHPHITALHSMKTMPFESVNVLKRLNSKRKGKGEMFIKMKKDIVFDAEIKVFRG